MKESLNFLLKINQLKEIPRTGWVWRGIQNPETIAEHTFRLTITSWLLAEKRKLNTLRAIKIALFHDLCEVYAGDITPVLYYPSLPKDEEKRKKVLMKWARLSQKEKEKIGKKKYQKERKSLLKLVKFLKPNLKNEILSLWTGYEKNTSLEGRFVQQLNRIETLIQSIEYFGTKNINEHTNWWEWANEIVFDPILLEFLKVIQKKFYQLPFSFSLKRKDLTDILNFLLEIGKLKRMPRLYWILRGIKNPETVAGHIFTVAIVAWLFGKERKELNVEKLLKMALCHELSAVHTGDTTPYDRILPENEKEQKKVLEKMIRLSKKEKEWIFLRDYREEKKALEKLTKKLKPSLKKEILQLWQEYRLKSSPEGRFLSQLNILTVLLQGLLYEKKDKNFSASPLWEYAFETCDDPLALQLMEEMKKKFYG